jgi:antiviral helicase SKI2
VPAPTFETGLTSTAIDRAPGPIKDFVRGKSGYVPFWPGGLEALLPERVDEDGGVVVKGLRTIAPGLSRGLRLPGEEDEAEDENVKELDDLAGSARGGSVVQVRCLSFPAARLQ